MSAKHSAGTLTASAGLGTQAGVLYTERRDVYLRPNTTKELWPSVTPFTKTIQTQVVKVNDPEYKLFEHRSGWIKQEFSINDATLTVNYDTYVPGDIATAAAIDGITGLKSTADTSLEGLMVEVWDSTKTTYKGLSLITDVTSGAVTFKSLGNPRSAANTHTVFADNDVCIVVGNAFGEGTEAPEAYDDDLSTVYNSCQIFKTPIEVTGTLYEMTALRGYSNELARLRAERLKEHEIQKERAWFFGQRSHGTGSTDLASDNTFTDSLASSITDADGKLVRTTMGIIPALYRYGNSSNTADNQNIFSIVGSEYDYAQFVADTEKIFQYIPNSGSKRAFCGMKALSFWSKLANDSGFAFKSGWNITLSDWSKSKLGFNVKYLETPSGILELVYAPILRGPYNGYMVIVDTENIGMAQFRPMKFQANIKTDNAYDGVKDQYMSDEGLIINLIETHDLMIIS